MRTPAGKSMPWSMANIVMCKCGTNEVRRTPGQTVCSKCAAAGVADDRPREKRDTATVTIPPSLYALWEINADGTKRRSPEYLAWIDANIGTITETFWWLTPPVAVVVTIYGGEGFNEARDIDNTLKAAIDTLVAATPLPDDCVRFITEIAGRYVGKGDARQPAYATIRVVEVRR